MTNPMTDRPMIYRDDAIEAMQALAPKHSQYTPAYIVEAQAALTALAPVHVGAAYIRAEVLREAAQVLTDEIDLARVVMPQVVPILSAVRRTILALIPTPAPSPDVGALVEAASNARLAFAGYVDRSHAIDLLDAALAKMKGGAE